MAMIRWFEMAFRKSPPLFVLWSPYIPAACDTRLNEAVDLDRLSKNDPYGDKDFSLGYEGGEGVWLRRSTSASRHYDQVWLTFRREADGCTITGVLQRFPRLVYLKHGLFLALPLGGLISAIVERIVEPPSADRPFGAMDLMMFVIPTVIAGGYLLSIRQPARTDMYGLFVTFLKRVLDAKEVAVPAGDPAVGQPRGA